MPWHYERDGRAVGPFDDAEMVRLAEGGRIDAISLVSRDGGKTWLSTREAAPLFGLDPARLQSGEAGPIERCSRCAMAFGSDQLTAVGELRVCAACLAKLPAHLEAAGEAAGDPRPGLWSRLLGWFSGG